MPEFKCKTVLRVYNSLFSLTWDHLALKRECPDSSMTERYVKTYVFTHVVATTCITCAVDDVNTSHTDLQERAPKT
jgi:hypothetical protein